MKAQVTSVLLCALLASTLGHEYLAAKRLAPEAKHKSALSHFQERTAKREQCDYICRDEVDNSNSSLRIIVNATADLIGVVNITAEVAIVIDINANLVGLFNGTGAAVIINVKTGAGVYIAPGQCGRVWISSRRSFEAFFKSLTSLQALNQHVGTKFRIGSASNSILVIVANLLVKLSGSNASEVQVKESIKILLRITSITVSSYRGALKGLLRFFGSGLIVLYGDIFWLVYVFEGLTLFFSKTKGGLAALIKAGVEFDFALLLRSVNGVQFLTNLLLRIVAREDLSVVSGVLNSDEVLAEVIVKLGGNVSTGVTGFWKIVYQIILVRSGRLKVEVLIVTLIEYFAGTKTPLTGIYLQGLAEVIKIQESRYSATSIKSFATLIRNLQNRKLVIGGVNLSGIVEALYKGAAGGVVLVLVVSVLLLLKSIIRAEIAILTLLLVLLRLLTSGAGVRLLLQVVPGLSLKVSKDGSVSIQEIFRGVSLITILRIISSGFDLNAILISVPVFGKIYSAVSAAVSSASSRSLSLKVVIKSSGSFSITVAIQAWIKEIVRIFQHGGNVGGVSTVTETSSYNYTYYVTYSGK